MKTEIIWKSADKKARPLKLFRPCPCGCDARGGLAGVGYLLGCDSKGDGVTLWIQDEATYKSISKLIPKGLNQKPRMPKGLKA